MASAAAEQAVRTYLTALKDAASLRDDGLVERLRRELEQAGDPLERLRLRQRLIDAEAPSIERHEAGFVEHARVWAQDHGVNAEAFATEGVPTATLRRAGFTVRQGRRTTRRSVPRRVRAEEAQRKRP